MWPLAKGAQPAPRPPDIMLICKVGAVDSWRTTALGFRNWIKVKMYEGCQVSPDLLSQSTESLISIASLLI